MDEGEEEEEEEELDHANIIAQYGRFNDVAMGVDNEEEVAAEDDRGDDAFGDAIRDAQRECESDKESQVRAHARGPQEIAISHR